jgi:hypothetical protein
MGTRQSVILLGALGLAACSESVFEHACEHSAAASSVDAAPPGDAASAPGTGELHKRYTIKLPGLPGGGPGTNEGVTKFTPGEAGDYRLFLSAKLPLKVLDGTTEVAPEATVDAAEGECASLVTAQTVALSTKTYVLRFGPTAATSVDLLVEEAAH